MKMQFIMRLQMHNLHTLRKEGVVPFLKGTIRYKDVLLAFVPYDTVQVTALYLIFLYVYFLEVSFLETFY